MMFCRAWWSLLLGDITGKDIPNCVFFTSVGILLFATQTDESIPTFVKNNSLRWTLSQSFHVGEAFMAIALERAG
jgi:hypothetical protein